MEKIIRNEIKRPLLIVRRDSNIPLISLDNYEVVRRELFSRRRRVEVLGTHIPRKEGNKKE